jgi:Uma2 family endonuclease
MATIAQNQTATRTEAEAPPEVGWDEPVSRFVFDHVSWADYEAILRCVGERQTRVTYDRGILEIMSPSQPHENFGYLLGVMVGVLCEAQDISFRGAGGPTFRRKDLKRGLEPDNSFYVHSFPKIRGKAEIDLATDPPPDIVIEVDISRSVVDRLGIYAALGVPEVWNFRQGKLRVLLLRESHYTTAKMSPTFPALPLDELTTWVHRAVGEDESAWRKALRAWVREQLAAPAKPKRPKKRRE